MKKTQEPRFFKEGNDVAPRLHSTGCDSGGVRGKRAFMPMPEPFGVLLRQMKETQTVKLAQLKLGIVMVRAISNEDNESRPGFSNQFTPAAATKMLPLVKMIVEDMVKLQKSIESQRERLRAIDRLPEMIDQPDYREEVSDIRDSLEAEERKLDACFGELASLGLEVHLPFDGSVDFPAVMNRRAVRLCWQPEDHQVEHWHEIGQAKTERQKINLQAFGTETRI